MATACTASSDTVCAKCRTCSGGEWEESDCTTNANRVCKVCWSGAVRCAAVVGVVPLPPHSLHTNTRTHVPFDGPSACRRAARAAVGATSRPPARPRPTRCARRARPAPPQRRWSSRAAHPPTRCAGVFARACSFLLFLSLSSLGRRRPYNPRCFMRALPLPPQVCVLKSFGFRARLTEPLSFTQRGTKRVRVLECGRRYRGTGNTAASATARACVYSQRARPRLPPSSCPPSG